MPGESIGIELRRTSLLSPSDLDEIWALTQRYIDTSRAFSEKKLLEMPEVGLWRTRGGELAGLVVLEAYQMEWRTRASTIIFTSSVVLDERYRGRNLVLMTGLRVLLREKLRRPLTPAYWFFDTFSYKSYLILPRNLAQFWPRRGVATPESVAQFIDHLARRRYGADWSAETGVVRRSGEKRLQATAAPLDSKALSDPDIRFFDTVNPGHRDGDMLVCLAPLSFRNMMGAIARRFRFR
jgi:hypothetical protein